MLITVQPVCQVKKRGWIKTKSITLFICGQSVKELTIQKSKRSAFSLSMDSASCLLVIPSLHERNHKYKDNSQHTATPFHRAFVWTLITLILIHLHKKGDDVKLWWKVNTPFNSCHRQPRQLHLASTHTALYTTMQLVFSFFLPISLHLFTHWFISVAVSHRYQ